jgi:hypothetical protein
MLGDTAFFTGTWSQSLAAAKNLQSLTFRDDDDKFAAAKWFDQWTSLSHALNRTLLAGLGVDNSVRQSRGKLALAILEERC